MPNIQVISRSRHAAKRWMRPANYNFAVTDALSPLVAQELPKAMMSLTIGFIAAEGAFAPVAIQGLAPGKNLFVGLDGRWVGGYIPAVYRCYPFVLRNTEDGQEVMCINEDSGLLSDSQGEPFFGEDDQPSKAITDVLSLLNHVGTDSKVTRRICAVLQKHNLIQSWPLKLQFADGEKIVEGLFRIDETAMNTLPAEAFMELRDTGALILAYCQLLSMQHLPLLGQLADIHTKASAPLPMIGADLDLSFMSDGGSLSFGAQY
jgi:hypothetical protein